MTTDLNEEIAAGLRQMAALAAGFYEDLRASGIPDEVAAQLVIDWHYWSLSGEAE